MPTTSLYPRPEYPRPDRQRGTREGYDWLNLNGPWEFRFDGDRRGVDEQWFQPDDLTWREQIIVPFCWESLAAWREADAAGNDNYYSTRVFRNPLEVNRFNHRSAPRYEIGWYRRGVRIPDNPVWRGQRVILTIGAADFFTDGWCNGRHLGHHEGGYTPFEFDLTDALTTDAEGRRWGWIVLRVEDPMDNHEQPVGKQWRWYTTTSGIWQTVFVEPRSVAHIDSFRITPDIDHATAHFAVSCEEADGCTVEVQAEAPDGTALAVQDLAVTHGMADGTLKIAPLFLWDPNKPHLYRTRLRLKRGDEVQDTISTRFGMRKIDFTPPTAADAPTHLRLNGVPRYVRGALYQSFFPEGVYTAGEAKTLRDDIECAKQAGFNFLRIHIKVDDPLVLHYADTLGMLLMADFPNFGEGGNTPLGRRRFEEMMRAAIKRDFNHPSIIAWCMFNETWGFGGQVDFVNLIHPDRPKPPAEDAVAPEVGSEAAIPAATDPAGVAEEALKQTESAVARQKLANLPAQPWVQSMWELAKRLDPTRLIEDMSVCHWDHLDYFAHGDTDINSWHFYLKDYPKAKAHIAKVVESTYPGSSFNYVPGYQHRGQPLINSEYGGIGALDGDRDVSWSFKFLTNELRRHDKIAAYIYTELHDVEWEFNGFLNYDRTPKEFGYDPRMINESNVLTVDAPPVSRVDPGAIVQVPVASSHYSSQRHEHVTLRWCLGGVDTFARLHQDLQTGAVPIAFPHRRVAPAHTIALQMPDRPMLCTLYLEAVRADGLVVARNFVQYFVSAGYPPAREETPRSLVLRQAPADWREAQWSGRLRTREQARARDNCFGQGQGYFEWVFDFGAADLRQARRLRVLAEVSAHRAEPAQTDDDRCASTLEVSLNRVRIHSSTLPNHPHDSRGVLSYLRGSPGGYGYLVNVAIEGGLLNAVAAATAGTALRLRCAVPPDAPVPGGLTVYGAECGRYPVCPTLLLEW